MSTTTSASNNGQTKTIVSSDNKFQRLALKSLAILCLLAALWLIIENISTPASFDLLGERYTIVLGILLALMGILFGAASGFFFYSLVLSSTKQTQVSQRKVERLEVTAESSTERVKVLEHKIETLEAALKRALSSNKEKS